MLEASLLFSQLLAFLGSVRTRALSLWPTHSKLCPSLLRHVSAECSALVTARQSRYIKDSKVDEEEYIRSQIYLRRSAQSRYKKQPAKSVRSSYFYNTTLKEEQPADLFEKVQLRYSRSISAKSEVKATVARFELARSKSNGLAIHRLNHSATLSKQDTLDEDRTHDLGFIRPTL